MTSAEGDAKLVLTRERGGWRDWFRSYSVMIDQQEAGHVKRGKQVDPHAPARVGLIALS
ncbi:MAG TPA: hypothetical protein VMA72_16275 [Streptosporangiaceae bacterium]|nr:hypothetical protein [Streptosporangiaceae bacterium]